MGVKSEAIARSFYPVQSPTTAGVSPIGMPIYAGVPSPYAYPSGMPPMQMPYGYAGEGMDPSRGNMGKGPSGDMKAPSPSNANNRKNNGGGSAQNKGNNQKGNKDGSQKMNGSPSNYNNNSNNNNNKSDNGGRQKDGNKKDKKDSKGGNEPAFNNNLADFPALDGAVNTATQTNTTVGSNSYINQIVNIAKPHMSEADQAAASVATAAERFQSVAVSGPGKGGNVSNNDNVTSSLSNSVWGNKTAVAAVQTPPFKPPTEKAVTTKVNAAVQAVKPTNVVTNEMETPSAGAKTAPSPAASPPAPAANPGSAASSVSPSAAASDGNAAPSKPPVPGSWAGIVSSGPMPDPNTVVKMAPKKTAGSAPTSPGRPSSDEKKKDGKKDGGDKSDSPKKKKGTGDNNSSGGGAGASSSTRKKEEAEKEVIESPSSWGGRPTFANILREAESKQSSQQSTDEQKGDQSSWVKAASS